MQHFGGAVAIGTSGRAFPPPSIRGNFIWHPGSSGAGPGSGKGGLFAAGPFCAANCVLFRGGPWPGVEWRAWRGVREGGAAGRHSGGRNVFGWPARRAGSCWVACWGVQRRGRAEGEVSPDAWH